MRPVAPSPSLRIRNGKVLVVGVGGLGSPAALALALAGVGTIGLIDPDVVELSNLQRQILHQTTDVGRPKVVSAREKLLRLNPTLEIFAYQERLQEENLPRFFRTYDFVIDATDGVATKFLINDGAVLLGTPFSYGGIVQFTGQTLTILPGQTTCLRCLFPEVPSVDDVPTCQEAGIIGSLAGSLGMVQAAEAVKYLDGASDLCTDRLLIYDALNLRWRAVGVRRSPHCPLCGVAPTITSLKAEGRDLSADCALR